MLRSLSTGSGVVAVCVMEAGAEVAAAVTAGESNLAAVVLRTVSRAAACALSTPVAVCGVDAVETGGAPLLTDSGPQPLATVMIASESTRRTKLRVLEGSMIDGGSIRARRSETRATRRVAAPVRVR